ncbi:MAG: hypothetical protein A2148_02580 [Chloroflexi bacterium RBG_16_68_14]|nr:MAG: hypothetical protein A2148_02580 [Chloroflexi bacterium RBG_16_68_14]
MPRIFTLDEATTLLPRLREIMREMQEKRPALDHLREELLEMARTASGNGRLHEEGLRRKRREARTLAARLNALLAEVNGLGCELKGLEEGLIDFPAEREGRTIYLCWKLGEERIAYWHELDTGFAGRQPL